MSDDEALSSVAIARMNDAALFEFARIIRDAVMPFAACYFVVGLLFTTYCRPTVGLSRVVAELTMGFVTTTPMHVAVAAVMVLFLVAFSSLVGWRHVLARGCPPALLALLRAASRADRVTLPNVGLALGGRAVDVFERERTLVLSMVDQLRRSLVIASTAPPPQHGLVRTTWFASTRSPFSRRSA
jgi:hypothetical protein